MATFESSTVARHVFMNKCSRRKVKDQGKAEVKGSTCVLSARADEADSK